MLLSFSLFFAITCSSMVSAVTPTVAWVVPGKSVCANFTLSVGKDDALYDDYLELSCDQEAISITDKKIDADVVTFYDSISKEQKRAYTGDVTFRLTLNLEKPVSDATVRLVYYKKSSDALKEKLIRLDFSHPQHAYDRPLLSVAADAQNSTIEYTPPTQAQADSEQELSLSCRISRMISNTDSRMLQCLLIFLLGALLSLTPCIYPMIPITVGILQGQGTPSFIRNLAVSFCYTLGIASTFALMGVTAAYTGKLFGSFMQHPMVIFLVVAMLLYLAFSMFGLYEMYIPKGFSSNNRFLKGGSPLAAFIFGIISGTVASPCVSPGLALVLSMVAGLANPMLGFAYMFAFGVGLSLPLFIVGTFSGSMNILPRAGSWMVEVKKMFGFVMLIMAIRYLDVILPFYATASLYAAVCAGAGYYFLRLAHTKKLLQKVLYNLVGIAGFTGAIVCCYFAARSILHPEECAHGAFWTSDYRCAVQQAITEHKLLLLKVEAPCCSMCTAIDKKFFKNATIVAMLRERYVSVHIDGSNIDDPVIAGIVSRYGIMGFPTILLIDPRDEIAVASWASDLYDVTVEQWLETLRLVAEKTLA